MSKAIVPAVLLCGALLSANTVVAEEPRLVIGGFIKQSYTVLPGNEIAFPVPNTPQRSYFTKICVRNQNRILISHGNIVDHALNGDAARPNTDVCYEETETGGMTVKNPNSRAMTFTIRVTDRYVRPLQRPIS